MLPQVSLSFSRYCGGGWAVGLLVPFLQPTYRTIIVQQRRSTLDERKTMYLSELDIIAISIALVSLMALVITSAVANARITRQRDEWRNLALTYEREQHD